MSVRVSFKIMSAVAEFDMSLSYEDDGLEFSPKIQMTPDNIRHILNRYAGIDNIHCVNIDGTNNIRIWFSCDSNRTYCGISEWTPRGFIKNEEYIDIRLAATIYFYQKPLVAWRMDPEDESIRALLDPIFADLKPVLVGTVIHYLPGLKQEAKGIVKANAARRARIMAGNAEAILAFLGENF